MTEKQRNKRLFEFVESYLGKMKPEGVNLGFYSTVDEPCIDNMIYERRYH